MWRTDDFPLHTQIQVQASIHTIYTGDPRHALFQGKYTLDHNIQNQVSRALRERMLDTDQHNKHRKHK